VVTPEGAVSPLVPLEAALAVVAQVALEDVALEVVALVEACPLVRPEVGLAGVEKVQPCQSI